MPRNGTTIPLPFVTRTSAGEGEVRQDRRQPALIVPSGTSIDDMGAKSKVFLERGAAARRFPDKSMAVSDIANSK